MCIPGLLEGNRAGPDAGGYGHYRKAGAFLATCWCLAIALLFITVQYSLCPVYDTDRTFGRIVILVQRPQYLEASRDAQDAVISPARWLRVEM